MKKLNIITLVGTRPEIIRLSAVINKLNKSKVINHILVHTGQNYDYELNEIFFKDFGLKKPDYFLNAASESSTKTIGNILIKFDELLSKINNIDGVLILGDTNSCLGAICAKKRKIPIFHMEAGNRCYDQRVPEEINRKIVDHISDINITYSDISREYLLKEGIPAERIIKSGSPMFEVISNKIVEINNSTILKELNLKKDHFFLVSFHREENVENENNFKNFCNTLNLIAEKYKLPIIVSTHPRTRNKIENIKFNQLINFSKPLGFIDYNCLQKNALVVLSDSGTISEESSILNLKSINIREAHERPEGMEETVSILTGLNIDRIIQSIELHIEDTKNNVTRNCVRDYTMPNVSDKIIKIILSHVDYINKFVWRKN